MWLITLGGDRAAHSVTTESLSDNILNFDLIVLVNVKAEARKSQFTGTLRLLN